MGKNKTFIAKISRPSISGIYPRTRLFKTLDDSRKQPLIWVSGPGGAGKTSLVASYLDARKLLCIWYKVDAGDADLAAFFYYMGLAAKQAAPRYKQPLPLLTPEYAHGIPVFTKRYFEELFRRLKPPYTLVLDNYQEMPADSGAGELLAEILSSIPEKINVIFISRNELPAAYIRLKANGQLAQIGWNELRFTETESKEIVQLKERRPLTDRILSLLHKKTEGWAAGLVLLIESLKLEDMDYEVLDRLIPRDVFKYFAGEIFKKTDEETRCFLLKSAFLPEMTARIAEELTGVKKAARILARLFEHNYFIEMHQKDERVYLYHPLFREFLIARARETFGQDEITTILKRAALLLVQSGQTEAAAFILIDSGDWNGLAQLALNCARSFLSQGRTKTLEEWLGSIPSHVLEAIPWLLFWKGVCRLPFSPAESRAQFEKAFQLFEIQKDDAGVLLAWSSIVDTFFYEANDFKPLDPLIDWLDERIRGGLSFPNSDIEATVASSMTLALLWRRMDHRDISKWVARALLLAQKSRDISLNMKAYSNALLYQLWMGDSTVCGLIVADVRKVVQQVQTSSPLILITLKSVEACYYTTSWENDRTIQLVLDGLKAARESGIRILDPLFLAQGVYCSLSKGDRATTEEFLGKMEAIIPSTQRGLYGHYLSLVAWHNLAGGNTSHAAALARKALSLTEETGTPYQEILSRLLAAQAMYETGDYEYAWDQLARAKKSNLLIGSRFLEYRCHLNEAYFAFGLGDESAGLEALRKAMTLGRRERYVNMLFIWRPNVMARLCAKALEAGIEVEYVQNLVRKLNLEPDDVGFIVETWPWPMKIYTLGRFLLIKDGVAVAMSGKVQKKPLEMLKALVALGGSDIRESELTDALWPEAEGDVASTSCRTTLHRLRQLIGNEKAIVVQDGRIGLDSRYCWADAWAFQRLIEHAGSAKDMKLNDAAGGTVVDVKEKNPIQNPQALAQHLEKAIALYRGRFLDNDDDKAWTASMRERLQNKFLRAVHTLGNAWMAAGQPKKAAACYERGLEVDDLAEDLYQKLMLCQMKLGRRSDAIRVYERCRVMLQSGLGVAPSTMTEEIFTSLRTTT